MTLIGTCRGSGVSRVKLLGRHRSQGGDGRKAESSDAGTVVVLAYARTPR
jgi:hypothetical protein